MKQLILALTALSLPVLAQTAPRFFEHKSKNAEIRISIIVEGDSVTGTQTNGSGEVETHGAMGTMTGNAKDGVLHVTYNYEIEGNRQSEEQLLKLDGNQLILAEGELEEHGPGQMVLKEPKKVKFATVLKEVTLKEFAHDTINAKPVMPTIDEALAKFVGAPVKLDGTLRMTRGWVRFTGSVSVAEGQKPKNAAIATQLEQAMVRAYLKSDGKGGWTMVRYEFEGVDGLDAPSEGQDYESQAPWPLDDDGIEY